LALALIGASAHWGDVSDPYSQSPRRLKQAMYLCRYQAAHVEVS